MTDRLKNLPIATLNTHYVFVVMDRFSECGAKDV